ncbi:hypothetical protein HAX54_030798 [Datura stramonium]|uniref:Uncharacterized protein n=1 Tax=Datura stramonium TaxID=4076 RepID=A0ABS8SBG0_DATST|nr:hypothetical protein [Datura stramonium]
MGLGLDARSAPSGGFGSAWWTDEEMNKVKEPQAENRKGKAFVDGCDERMKDMNVLMKQVLSCSEPWLEWTGTRCLNLTEQTNST